MLKTQGKTKCDVLVIGSGGAGLRAAIEAASVGADVLLISKARIGCATNTYLSKAIVASTGWGGAEDNSEIHAKDTIEGGRHINNPDMVKTFTQTVSKESATLQQWGVEFALNESGNPIVTKIPGHSHARHLFGKNWKGSDIIIPLKKKAKESGVHFMENFFVTSLIMHDDVVCGITAISEDGKFFAIQAKTVILCTGGYSHVFLNTNNAPGITGDGQILAFNAGAILQDLEFVQFYPTAAGKRGSRLILYERILVQEGATLRNSRQEDILKKNGYQSAADITRDELARLIIKEIREDKDSKGFITMDLETLSEETARGLSMLIPAQWFKGLKQFQVTPTTHFCMGGIVVDSNGQTGCSGLFAAGEVTAGAHGANRLGGNALAEVIAMGSQTGRAAAEKSSSLEFLKTFDAKVKKEKHQLETMFCNEGEKPKELIQWLKETMWVNCGIIREKTSLEHGLKTLEELEQIQPMIQNFNQLIKYLEFRNMCQLSQLICLAAVKRTETRGAHFRKDFPDEDNDHWQINLQVRQAKTGCSLKRVSVKAV